MDNSHLIIAGMHRSGTSVVASICSALGYGMGDDLMGGDPSNVSGHFEDLSFVALNQKVLVAAGGDWDSPPTAEACYLAFNKYRAEYAQYIASKRGLWGVKDPRVSLFFENYYMMVASPVRVIYCSRNEGLVAASLAKRNKIDFAEACNLKREYDRRLEFSFQSLSVEPLRISFEQLMSNPGEEILKIAEYLDLTPSSSLLSTISATLMNDDELRRGKRKAAIIKLLQGVVKGLRSPGKIFRKETFIELKRLIRYINE